MANATRQEMIPNNEMIIILLLPYRSTNAILTTEPTALRSEVTRERARAVLFDANPAN